MIQNGGRNMRVNPDAEEYRSTRLVCAKLYEGGLLNSYSILNGIKRRPFAGKSPEFELNINLIIKHAEKAFQYHLNFALIAAGLTFLGLIFYAADLGILSHIFLIATIVLLSWKSLYLNRTIALNNFSKKSFNPAYRINDLLVEHNIITPDDELGQNVIVFGDYFPFLGTGHRARNWNFVIDTTKQAKNPINEVNFPKDISIEEIYTSVSQKIQEKCLPNLSWSYVLFADGNELDKTEFLLPDRVGDPIRHLDADALFSEGHRDNYKDYRTYMNIRYYDKVRSTLFSTFLRFSKTGKEIFAECSFYILPPIDENKYNIDKLPLNDDLFSLKIGLITLGFIIAYITIASVPDLAFIPLLVLAAVAFLPLFIILIGLFNDYKNKRQLKSRIERGSPHNYGRAKTFREAIASPNYKNYFSAQDIIMVQNSLEQTIINTVADLLDSKGIDSSFLRNDLLAFVNQGIMMFGGKMEAEQIAIGKGSQAVNQIFGRTQKLLTSHKEA
jgi:hypothetical protein